MIYLSLHHGQCRYCREGGRGEGIEKSKGSYILAASLIASLHVSSSNYKKFKSFTKAFKIYNHLQLLNLSLCCLLPLTNSATKISLNNA